MFNEMFGYKKHRRYLVLKKPHDIACRYHSLKKTLVYWDDEEEQEVDNDEDEIQ